VPFPSLVRPVRAHRSDSCAGGASPSSPRRVLAPPALPRDPALPLKVRNPPTPLIWSLLLYCSRDCSPELSRTAVSLPRRVQCLLLPPRRRDAHGRVRQTTLIVPELNPNPLVPRRGQPPRLRQALAVGPSGATAPVSTPGR
jgi:hypothetical protein